MSPPAPERGLFRFELVQQASEANGRTWRLRLISIREAAVANKYNFRRRIWFFYSQLFTDNLQEVLIDADSDADGQ